ncbi:hypothetical protein MMN97_27880, partial [Escherichia coli]|nr:hypothetical protein [Escherichia coli]
MTPYPAHLLIETDRIQTQVVDLSLDAARFDEQMARVRRHFSGTESDAKKTAAVVEQSLSRQALAAQKAGISVGQYKAAMRTLPAQFTD